MKNILISFCFILANSFFGFAQVNLNFENENEYGTRIILGNDSLWQIAVPSKGRFTGAFSGNRALLTDSANLIPDSSNALIEIVLFKSHCSNLNLSFNHKYYTDSLHAGGRVEVSYDDGLSWLNVIYDTLYYDTYFQNFYSPSDTISNGIPSFTGSCNDWQNSSIWLNRHFTCGMSDSIRYRFIYESDSIAMPMEGWMIDDINLYVMPCSIKPNVNSLNQGFEICNESIDSWSITLSEPALICFFTMDGKTMYSKDTNANEKLFINGVSWPSGNYMFTFKNSKVKISRIVNKP